MHTYGALRSRGSEYVSGLDWKSDMLRRYIFDASLDPPFVEEAFLVDFEGKAGLCLRSPLTVSEPT